MSRPQAPSNLSDEQFALLTLHTLKVGSKSLFGLKQRYGSYEQAFSLYHKGQTLGLTEEQVASIAERETLLSRLLELIDHYDIRIIIHGDEAYPYLLTEMTDPPAVLYVRGALDETRRMAIVGSRKCTGYGQRVAADLGSEAGECQVTVVSGLALGIDAAAHKAVLAHGGKTIGVLACGVEQIYPASHRRLAEDMIQHGGAVVSEYPLLTPPYRGNFLVRNRIIAALSELVVVVEASLESGALVTARLALDYNRDVWAVPGDIYRDGAIGPHTLITNGATPYLETGQIATYFDRLDQPKELPPLDEEQQELLHAISKEGTHIDSIAEVLSLDIAATNSRVILLELNGLVKHEGAGIYRKII